MASIDRYSERSTWRASAVRHRARLTGLATAGLLAGCPGPVEESPAQAAAESSTSAPSAGYRVVTVAEGLEHPWGMAFLPDGEGILVTERPGRLRIVRDGQVGPPIDGVPPVRAQGESGLLDIALHPDFANNRLVYLSYAKPGDAGSTTAVARGRLDGERLEEVEDVFVADAWGPAAVNHGGRIAFDRDGLLYVTVGDRREDDRAQDLSDHAGTVVRLHDDGSVPEDNPVLAGDVARREIFTFGHRNALGLLIHPETGEIWLSENAAAGGDEINLLIPGMNYGWPVAGFGRHYDGRSITPPRPGDGTQPPVHYWVPGVSPSGLALYDGAAFPDWRGDLFSGSLQARHLTRLRFEVAGIVEQERLLADRGDRIRDVAISPDGLIYLLVDAPAGALLRIEPE